MRFRLLALLLVLGCADRRDAPAQGTDDGVAVPGTSSETPDDDDREIHEDFPSNAPLCPTEPQDSRPRVSLADPTPPAVGGGTLLLATTSELAFAADPDRDEVHIVDRHRRAKIASVALEPGAEPGRIVEDHGGLVHVLLRGAGAIATIDPNDAAIVATHEACGNPRGLAVDHADGSLVVACAEGVVVRIDPHGERSTIDVGIELRDVIEVGPPLRVSAWRTAEVLTLDARGRVIDSVAPRVDTLAQLESSDDAPPQPNSARRALAIDGGWAVLYQAAFPDRVAQSASSYYDGHCLPLQAAVVTWQAPGADVSSWPSPSIVPAFDFALSRVASWDESRWLAIVGGMRGGWALQLVVIDASTSALDGCNTPHPIPLTSAPISVAFDHDGQAWVQLREPAQLVVFDPLTEELRSEIELSQVSVADTGHELFHAPTDSRVACASCHPEGRDDGIAWQFEDEVRRTQALDIGLAGSEPFHWHGDLPDMEALVAEIRGERMCGVRTSAGEDAAVARFVFGLRPMVPASHGTADAIARGAELFAARGCATCHVGARFTNDQTMSIAGIPLQVPSLLGVAFRPPFMHDGRAATLGDTVDDMLAISVPGGAVTQSERADLVAFLASL